jgi:hypothetical protein
MYILFFLCFISVVFPLSVSPETAKAVGERIWKNECAGSVEGLTHWNQGENFASFGIGHFIWYSEGKRERFHETFPDMLLFLRQKGVALPAWLNGASACPWNSREEFYAKRQSPEMQELRQLLLETKSWQAQFMAERLERSFAEILGACAQKEKKRVEALFQRLCKEANGLYALIDYLNFKGAGTAPSERYKGQGWGLLQVLQEMRESAPEPLEEFVRAAKVVLRRRVQNAPPERNEERWLKGWCNRLDSYTHL